MPRLPEHLRSSSERALEGIFRYGRVDSVDSARHRVVVRWEEEGDGADLSDELPVLVQRPGDYALPLAGALAVCVMLPHADDAGFVLGFIYSDEDAAPLDDKEQRALASSDLRLGAADADDPVALASKVKEELQQLKQHAQAWQSVVTGAPINEPGNGSPSLLQQALAAALQIKPYPSPGDVGAENVKAK